MATGPGFLGIGAHKGGTSWLWQQLRAHPDVWMPPVKELHYFDRTAKYTAASPLRCATLPERLLGSTPSAARARVELRKRLRAALLGQRPRELWWTLRYLGGTYDDRWYLSLFDGRPGKTTGEITPGYSRLDDEDVQRVARLLPDVKVLFLTRHPVDRAWSHVRFNFSKTGRDPDALTLDQLRAFMTSPRAAGLSDTVGVIRRWRRALGPERVWVGYFDDLRSAPGELLRSVYSFIGVRDAAELVPADAARPVHVSPARPAPPEFLRWLADHYLAESRELVKEVDAEPPRRWLADLEALAAGRR